MSEAQAKIVVRQIKYVYGLDPLGQGFFWPDSQQKRQEWLDIKRNQPMMAETVYQCRPGAREGSVFLESDFCPYSAPGDLSKGVHDPQVRAWLQTGTMVAQAWDTSMSAQSDADFSVCVTGLFVPSSEYHRGEVPELLGACEDHYIVYILDVYRAQLDIGDLIGEMRTQYLKWAPQIIAVEKKAHGSPAMQALQFSGLPLEAVEANDNKRARAVTAIGQNAGSTQGWFRQHRVRIPQEQDCEWVAPYKVEMKDFTGQKGNRDDQVDATVHLVNYAIREGGNTVRFAEGWSTPYQIDQQMSSPLVTPDGIDPWMMLNDPELSEDPFQGMCGRCRFFSTPSPTPTNPNPKPMRGSPPSFCIRHRRRMPAIATCEDFSTEAVLSIPVR